MNYEKYEQQIIECKKDIDYFHNLHFDIIANKMQTTVKLFEEVLTFLKAANDSITTLQNNIQKPEE